MVTLKIIKKNEMKRKNEIKRKSKKKEKNKINEPPKNKKYKNKKKKINKYLNDNNIKSSDNSSSNKLMNKDNKIIVQINIIKGVPEDNKRKSIIKREIAKDKILKMKKEKEKNIISNLPTKGLEIKNKSKNKYK